MTTLRRFPLILLLAGGLAAPALAGPPATTYLTPAKFSPTLGETVDLQFVAGDAKSAQVAPWPADPVEWLFVRGGPTQENRHDVTPDRKGGNTVAVKIDQPGVTAIGADLKPTTSAMTGAELRAFCEANVGDVVADALKTVDADRKLRVRHVASSKLLIRAGDASGEPCQVAMRRTGQKVELRPIADPTAVPVGSDLPLFAYVEGAKHVGIKVTATHVATGKSASFVCDPVGSGHFTMTDPGLWRVEFYYAEPLKGGDADWAIYSGTLSFEVTAKGAAQ